MNKTVESITIKLTPDRYGGIIIDSSTIPQPLDAFENTLIEIISDQKHTNLLWITLPIGKSGYIPLLTKYDFVFFDCNETSITLLKRLAADPIIPTATNHTIGVGAFVRNENEILVVKDNIYKKYKLPGGYIDNKENISQALSREVLEETGVTVCAESIVTLSHFSPGQFGESNIYMVCRAKPLTKEINIIDDHEIIEARWMAVDEYIHRKDVHPYNKKIIKTALRNDGIKLDANDFSLRKNHQHEFYCY